MNPTPDLGPDPESCVENTDIAMNGPLGTAPPALTLTAIPPDPDVSDDDTTPLTPTVVSAPPSSPRMAYLSVDSDRQNVNRRHVTFSGKSSVVTIDTSSCGRPDNGPASPKSITSQSSDASEIKKRRRHDRKVLMKLCISFLFVFMVSGIALIYHFYHAKQKQIVMDQRFVYGETSRDVTLYSADRSRVLRGVLGINVRQEKLPSYCGREDAGREELCLVWKGIAALNISSYDTDAQRNCYDISWVSLTADLLLEDCFELGDDSWFGGGLVSDQRWPLSDISIDKTAFVAGTPHSNTSFGPVLEPYFINSAGFSLTVDSSVPLHISVNRPRDDTNQTLDNRLCLYSEFSDPYRRRESHPSLSYTLCVGSDVSSSHYAALTELAPELSHRVIKDPIVRDPVIRDPVWSTAPFLPTNFTQEQVQDFLSEIASLGFNVSNFILDGAWSSASGSFVFDVDRFPYPGAVISAVRSLGSKLTLAVSPYVDYDTPKFVSAVQEGMLVLDETGRVPGLTQYSVGPPGVSAPHIAGVIDVTGPGKLWLRDKLQRLAADFAVDGFYLVGGQIDTQPIHPVFSADLANPSQYLTLLADVLSDDDLRANQITESAYRCQRCPGLVGISGKTSTWDGDGLQSVIPTVLTLGTLGYTDFLPSVVGGNGSPQPPSKQLYIRWLQLSAFLPIMHFSVPPSFYDQETVTIATAMIELHQTVVAPVILSEVDTRVAVITPLWAHWPDDPNTYEIDSQFMVAGQILVAPIVTEGSFERDIYIPEGVWKGSDEVVITGPKWLKSVPVPLDNIPYFLMIRGNSI